MRILLLESARRTTEPTREGSDRMKFELVEPSDESDGNAAVTEPRNPAPADGIVVLKEPDAASPGPVRERRARAVEGVRASLELLRARVAEQSMAEVRVHAAEAPEAEAGALFHAHRFAADTSGEENR
ncbi:cell envelope biogenesis protein TolA [Nocardiopsis dassonvillei]|uniref:cell envelope biogenesis protein TolA n=1 Tax=Nocardiopsis dassonvillei TaxID=2014 RepID=UPI00102AF9B9|nr:cell envelope biogenesis protein TolA [Nocardiopsis dassonvillei]MCP3014946.1 cell envelope biogenesis protein TolA [Nocardiopsis dassonvillei]